MNTVTRKSHEYFNQYVFPKLRPRCTGADRLHALNWRPETESYWNDDTDNLYRMWIVMCDFADDNKGSFLDEEHFNGHQGESDRVFDEQSKITEEDKKKMLRGVFGQNEQ